MNEPGGAVNEPGGAVNEPGSAAPGRFVGAAEDVRRALRHGPKTLAEIAEFCGRPSRELGGTVGRMVHDAMIDADRTRSPVVYSFGREPIAPGIKKELIEGTREAEIAAVDSSDDSIEGSIAPAEPDLDLNAWHLRTRDCPNCSRVNGLRRLCSACHASLPVAKPGVKHNVRQAQISVGRKFVPRVK